MTMKIKRKRNVKLAIATVAMTVVFIATAVGIMTKASAGPTAIEDAPENVEKVVTDLSKYVMLHQTRSVGMLILSAPRDVLCDDGRTASAATSNDSI